MAKRKPEKLTHTFIKSVAKEGRYGDGRGGLGLSPLKNDMQSRYSATQSVMYLPKQGAFGVMVWTEAGIPEGPDPLVSLLTCHHRASGDTGVSGQPKAQSG